MAQYRFRTAALVGPYRTTRREAVHDALRAGQAHPDTSHPDGVRWAVPGTIETVARHQATESPSPRPNKAIAPEAPEAPEQRDHVASAVGISDNARHATSFLPRRAGTKRKRRKTERFEGDETASAGVPPMTGIRAVSLPSLVKKR